MSNNELILKLVRHRLEKNGLARGLSVGESCLMAEHRLKNEGLLGFFKTFKLMQLPEGVIVHIVETYLRALVHQIKSAPQIFSLPDANPIRVAAARECVENAAKHIEQHRSKAFGGIANYPKDFLGYVVYRVQTDHRKTQGSDPEEIGLDRETIEYMANECREYFRPLIK